MGTIYIHGPTLTYYIINSYTYKIYYGIIRLESMLAQLRTHTSFQHASIPGPNGIAGHG